MWANSHTFNGGSAYTAMAVEDRTVRSMPWLFRVTIPGFQAGWPPQ